MSYNTPDYEQMYNVLRRAVEQASAVLAAAQRRCGEIYDEAQPGGLGYGVEVRHFDMASLFERKTETDKVKKNPADD